jgi:hypothetical protein
VADLSIAEKALTHLLREAWGTCTSWYTVKRDPYFLPHRREHVETIRSYVAAIRALRAHEALLNDAAKMRAALMTANFDVQKLLWKRAMDERRAAKGPDRA